MSLPLNIDLQQILLHVFNFLLLTGGLYFLLYNPIKKFMDSRLAEYRALDEKTEGALTAAREKEEQAQAKLDGMEEELRERRLVAEQELNAYCETEKEKARVAAETILADAVRNAEAEKREILQSADREIVDLAKNTVEKLLHADTEEAYNAFLDTAQGDLKK